MRYRDVAGTQALGLILRLHQSRLLGTDFRDAQAIDFKGAVFRLITYPLRDVGISPSKPCVKGATGGPYHEPKRRFAVS